MRWMVLRGRSCLHVPATLAACAHPSQDSAAALRSLAVLRQAWFALGCDVVCGFVLRFLLLQTCDSAAATDIPWDAKSHRQCTERKMSASSAPPPPQNARVARRHPSSSRPSLSSPRRASRAGSVKDVSGRFVKDVMGLNKPVTRGGGDVGIAPENYKRESAGSIPPTPSARLRAGS